MFLFFPFEKGAWLHSWTPFVVDNIKKRNPMKNTCQVSNICCAVASRWLAASLCASVSAVR